MGCSSEIIVSLRDFNGHVGKCAKGFEGVHGGNDIGKRNAEGRRLLEFCDEKELRWQTISFIRQTKGKLLIALMDVKQKLILCLWGEKYRKYIRNAKVIPWELQYRLVVVDLDKKVLKKVVRKQWTIRRKIWKLNENQTRVRFENKVKELVSTNAPD